MKTAPASSPRRSRSVEMMSAGLRAYGQIGSRRTYWPSLPSSSEPVLIDGGRSRLPLRGSPGITPGSLLPLRSSGAPTVRNRSRRLESRSSCPCCLDRECELVSSNSSLG